MVAASVVVVMVAGFSALVLAGGSAAGQTERETLPVVGTIQVDGLSDAVPLHEVTIGVVGATGGTTGGAVGEPGVLEPLSVVASVGASAPKFIELALTGRVVRMITVDLLDPTDRQPIGRITAQNVQVSNVAISTEQGNPLQTIEWGLATAATVRIDSGGASFCWDLSRTRPC
ncbi:MAG: hypothetical protein MUE34_11400 [Acidimicrobiales bacterium]|nr:hypothetical protein [Acidimicrobiales bacterium]